MVGDNEVLAHPEASARELRLDAMLAEAAGAGPSADLEERIVAALRREAALPRRAVWAWAAALLVAGLAVVAAVAFGREGEERSAPAQQQVEDAGQEPEPDPEQDPEADPKLAREVARLVRELELPEKRGEVLRQLVGIGVKALPLLEKALAEERQRGRPEVLAGLTAAIAYLNLGEAKAKLGWPVDKPVILVADYSENRIVAVGADGKTLWAMEEVFGAWDVELTSAGTLLVTEFSVSRVQEVDKDGKVVWHFEGLKNPYDADRLPGGNTLIADTFGSRVIEVTPKREIVWETKIPLRPFDADRLPDGNTLIADVLGDRVIEVSPAGDVVWEVKGMPNCHDADRLPNGNTLVTLRSLNKVVEVDRSGKIVWEVGTLNSPSDADRLPDGTTLVAQNGQVVLFDAAGKRMWMKAMTWAVEANRY